MASKVVKGIVWSAVERFSVQGVSFCLSIIIARLVTPSAYGVIAILNVFLSFSQVFIDSGFGHALIQKKDRTEVDFSTTFIYSMAVAIFIYMLLFIGAPYVADFYNDDSLCAMLRIISFDLIFSSMSIIQRCRLTINLDFKTQTKASLTSVITSGCIGVTLAYQGYGAWALVVQSISSSFMTSVSLMYYSRWKPRLEFSKNSFDRLFSFASKQLITNIITSIYLNLSNLCIGKFYSTEALGFYNRGFTLSQFLSTNITGVLNRIVYPVECELQNEPQKLRDAHFKYLRLNCYIIFPLSVLLAVLSKPLILLILTEKWEPTAYYLSVLSLAFMWYPLLSHYGMILPVKGMTGVSLMASIPKRIVTFALLVIILPIGPKAIAWGLVLANFNETIVNGFFVKKYIGYPFWKQYTSIADIFTASIACGVVAYLVVTLFSNVLLQLIIGGILGCLTFIILTYAFKMSEKEIWNELFKRII